MKKQLAVALLLIAAGSSALFAQSKNPPFNVVEATIPQMQAALKAGRVTSHDLVAAYLIRIATYEDTPNAAITVNPNALQSG